MKPLILFLQWTSITCLAIGITLLWLYFKYELWQYKSIRLAPKKKKVIYIDPFTRQVWTTSKSVEEDLPADMMGDCDLCVKRLLVKRYGHDDKTLNATFQN